MRVYSNVTLQSLRGMGAIQILETNDNNQFVRFGVVGNVVEIIDKRKMIYAAIKAIDYRKFAENKFSKPCMVEVQSVGDMTTITLSDSPNQSDEPLYCLWIAVGIKDQEIPDYEYSLYETYELEKDPNKLSMVSLYKRPIQNHINP